MAQFLDFAELQAKRQTGLGMADWLTKLDEILKLNGFAALSDAGRVSAQVSGEHAHAQYASFEELRSESRRRELESEPDGVAELADKLSSLGSKCTKKDKGSAI